MKFRKHFDYDVEAASDEARVDQSGPEHESLTVQSMAEDADINVIMKRFGITGKMPENPRVPMYGDFTEVKDFQTALNAVGEAFEGFMALPAEVRARFRNNPQELLEFCADEGNLEEARKLGLLKESSDGGRSGGTGAAAAAGAAVGAPAQPGGGDQKPAGSGAAAGGAAGGAAAPAAGA